MKSITHYVLSSALLLGLSGTASAITVDWTDWQSSADTTSVSGVVSGIDVEFSASSAYHFVQLGSGVDYWSEGVPPAYTGGSIDNRPTAAEMIALSQGGTVTFSFAETVYDPYIAINSWNGNTVEFGTPISFDSVGKGYWGSGSYTMNGAGTGFSGNGELHGLIQLKGAFDSFSFTHTGEAWHGVTVALPVPEAETYAMLLAGLGVIGWMGRRRKQV